MIAASIEGGSTHDDGSAAVRVRVRSDYDEPCDLAHRLAQKQYPLIYVSADQRVFRGVVELPGIEPGSYGAASGILRVQFV